MPLNEIDFQQNKRRIFNMFMDTVKTFRIITDNVESLFPENSKEIKAAINEYLEDFIDQNDNSRNDNPEGLIYRADIEDFQRVGFYGAQLDLKERQVLDINKSFRSTLFNVIRPSLNLNIFKKWIDIINNFLGSLISATGAGEALKELKDCLRGELDE